MLQLLVCSKCQLPAPETKLWGATVQVFCILSNARTEDSEDLLRRTSSQSMGALARLHYNHLNPTRLVDEFFILDYEAPESSRGPPGRHSL